MPGLRDGLQPGCASGNQKVSLSHTDVPPPALPLRDWLGTRSLNVKCSRSWTERAWLHKSWVTLQIPELSDPRPSSWTTRHHSEHMAKPAETREDYSGTEWGAWRWGGQAGAHTPQGAASDASSLSLLTSAPARWTAALLPTFSSVLRPGAWLSEQHRAVGATWNLRIGSRCLSEGSITPLLRHTVFVFTQK